MGTSEGIQKEFSDSISSSIRELFKFTGDNDEEKVAIADEGAKRVAHVIVHKNFSTCWYKLASSSDADVEVVVGQ